jgi:hypothetical protein
MGVLVSTIAYMKRDYLKITKACLASIAIIGTILPQIVGASNGGFWSWFGIVGDEQVAIENQTKEIKETSDDTLHTMGSIAFIQPVMPIAQRFPQYAPYCAYSPNTSYCLTTVTAYSSTADQTDSSPFITANGKNVKDGIVACNFLAFGTKVKFPDMYGDKVFTVEEMKLKSSVCNA